MSNVETRVSDQPTVPSEIVRQLLITAYEAYDQGLRGFVAELFDDEVEWTMYCPPESLPIPNRMRGKAAVLDALRRIDEVVEIVKNELVFVSVEGENAAVICDRTLRQRGTDRIMRYKMAAFHRFRNGRIVEYQGFADGVDILQQAIGREVDLPAAYPTK